MNKSSKIIGIGLRCQHYSHVLQQQPSVDWLEVHSENYFFPDSNQCQQLYRISEQYPISLHGIALSLGSSEGVDNVHLSRIKQLINNVNPFLVSEHLSWSRVNNIYLPDLLPVAYTDESAEIFIRNIDHVQEVLQQQILVENPSSYFEYQVSHIDEAEFLVYIAQKTGCKILLDVNNIFVSCTNHNWNSLDYINKIPKGLVAEIHLAGHSMRTLDSNSIIRVDTHNDFVCDEVWQLYLHTIERFGILPTLLEWDQDIPELSVLVSEANKANKYINQVSNHIKEPLIVANA